MMKKFVLPTILGVVGLVAVLLAVILGWAVVPNIIHNQIEEEVRLIDGSDTFDKWETNPFPAFIEFYILNITNPSILDNFEIPVFEEFGPYVYEELRVKHNVTFNDDGTITYVQRITYLFREDMSSGPSAYDPVFTTINSPFLIVAQAIYELVDPWLANFIINLLFIEQGETFIVEKVSVNDLIFNGFPLIESYGIVLSLLDEPPPEFEGNRFAFYRGQNGSHDGVYRIHDGVRNSETLGEIVTWEGETRLNWWKSPDWLNNTSESEDKYCNMINGTDGSIWAPFIKKTDELSLFVTDLCRSIVLKYEKNVKHRDIPGYSFVLPESFYEGPSINGDNYCFCTSAPKDLQKGCGEGIIRLFPCKQGAPIVVSSPHFLSAGKEFVELGLQMGLNPDYEKHHTRVDVEPNSGVTLSVAKKIQVNMEIQNFTNVDYFSNLGNWSHIIFPVFWANEFADIDDKLADDIKSQLLTPLKIVKISKWSVLAVGGILMVAGAVLYIYLRRKAQ